jgi:hypothetical protein
MLFVLPLLSDSVSFDILRSLRAVSMDPNALDMLEEAGAIPALIPFLGSKVMSHQIEALVNIYYLCSIKASRQEEAALNGVIPHLQRLIITKHPFNQFAYPIIFALCKTSKVTRNELKKYNAIQFFLDLLKDPNWSTHALEALTAFVGDLSSRVEFVLTTPSNINKLYLTFQTTTNAMHFERILPQFRKLLTGSLQFNQAFARSNGCIRTIKDRLERYAKNNNIRGNLLKILALIIVGHKSPQQFMNSHNLLPVLTKIAEDKESVIVRDLADKLVKKCTENASLVGYSSTSTGSIGSPFVTMNGSAISAAIGPVTATSASVVTLS